MKNLFTASKAWLVKHKEAILLIVLLLFTTIAHGYFMFQYPYFENDEGTYMSQAWSLIEQGQLAPYTYWYDHAPAGWMFIALWVKLTGGFFTFGTSVESGRVLMLLLHIATTFFLFKITKKLSASIFAATVAVLFFALSPLELYYGRRVLLDNIMIFWMFLSLFLLTNTTSKLRFVIASAIAFGIAVLTKENAIFFIPAFLYLLYTKLHNHHRTFAIANWLTLVGIIISFYFIYAHLRNELLPTGFMGDSTEHVSLLKTLQEQASRGTNYPFWDTRSDFWTSLQTWLNKDSFLIFVGIAASYLSILISVKNKAFRLPALLVTLFWLFLLRGKLVIDFYIVPLIPLLALNIGMVSNWIITKLSFNRKVISLSLAMILLVGIAGWYLLKPPVQYTQDETTPQKKTIAWIKDNLPQDAHIIIDDYMYVDLHASRFTGDPVFPNAHWAWKVEKDPSIKLSQDNNDWDHTLYITLSHEIVRQMQWNNFPYIKAAINNATRLEDWNGGTAYRNIPAYISTNGDWMSIYKVNDKNSIILDSSWKYYKSTFIHSYGQVIDPQSKSTTSEGQSYAMLRAVWENDQNTFKGVWAWTQDHFQYRNEDKLFSWQSTGDGETFELTDSATASDADQDIAVALLFAYQKWGNREYLTDAKQIIQDIWRQEVVTVNGRYYLMASNGGERVDGYLVNPSYLSPAYYRIFAEVDQTNPWNTLATDSYLFLNYFAAKKELPPNWVLVKKQTGEITSASKYVDSEFINDYGFDAFRTFWRIAQDAKWHNSLEAKLYLNRYEPLMKKYGQTGKTPAILSRTGVEKVDYDSLSTSVGALSVFAITDAKQAENLYDETFEKSFNLDGGYWKDKENYYDQNWGWFGTALYSDNLPNLWK